MIPQTTRKFAAFVRESYIRGRQEHNTVKKVSLTSKGRRPPSPDPRLPSL